MPGDEFKNMVTSEASENIDLIRESTLSDFIELQEKKRAACVQSGSVIGKR